MSINQKFIKLDIQVVSTLLNNSHLLIYKVDLLRTKVLKLRSEVAEQNVKLVLL